MINKNFSLYDAYSFGIKTILNNLVFFQISMVIGGLSAMFFLGFLGLIDYTMFREHFESLMKLFSHALSQPLGALHLGNATMHDHLRDWVPHVIEKYMGLGDVVSLDITREDVTSALFLILPTGLAFKLFLDLLSIGWAKISLDLQANKKVEYDYLYKFYVYVPFVFAVDLLVFIPTILGLALFIIPGLFVFERLRFARYFVFDKNQSIIQALESSWKLTDGIVIHLLGYSVFAFLLGTLSHVFVLFMFLLLPLSYVVDAHVYRQMVK